MTTSKSFYLLVAALALTVIGCDTTGITISSAQCEPQAVRCDGERIQSCSAQGQWAESLSCPTGEACMVMDSGMTHCMAPPRAPRALYLGSDAEAATWWVAAVDPVSGATLAVTEITALTALSAGAAPGWGDAVAGPDGRRIFANARSLARVLVLDADTLAVEAILEVGPTPTHIYNPNHGGEIWTHSDVEGSFYIIDAETLEVSGPVSAALTASGHGKLLYGAGLGDKYYATNTNDPGVFPIDGAAKSVGAIVNVCGVPCVDNPETLIDESQLLCGGTHDKAYNPLMDLVIVQCSGGRGYSFIDAVDNRVVENMRPITGSVAQSPDQRITLIIDGKRAAGQVQVWDTAAAAHDGLSFDAHVTVGDGPSARGVQFRAVGEGWESWIPQTGGDKLAVVAMDSLAVTWVTIGPLTAPPGASHFSRYAALGTQAMATYDDAGVVIVATADHTVIHGDALPGEVARVLYVEDVKPVMGGHAGNEPDNCH
jgi:hypothetical protein